MNAIHRLITGRWLRKFSKREIVPSVRAVFLGDTVSTVIMLKGQYEQYELELLAREVFPHLDAGGTCLDIGANIGNHSAFFSKHFERVVSFEPNPVVHHLLSANMFGSNVEVINIGLSDKAGTLGFSQDWGNMGGSKVTAGGGDTDIQVAPLDDLDIAGLDAVTFVKIDVEGHEAQALRGAAKLLAKHQPVIALEAHFKSDPEHSEAVLNELTKLGYSQFYRMRMRSEFARGLVQKGYSLRRGFWNVVLSDRVRKEVQLEACADPSAEDHSLLIAAARPIAGVQSFAD